jgi:hypothetical protein
LANEVKGGFIWDRCLVVCSDKIRESDDRRIEALSGTSRNDYKAKTLFVDGIAG